MCLPCLDPSVSAEVQSPSLGAQRAADRDGEGSPGTPRYTSLDVPRATAWLGDRGHNLYLRAQTLGSIPASATYILTVFQTNYLASLSLGFPIRELE